MRTIAAALFCVAAGTSLLCPERVWAADPPFAVAHGVSHAVQKWSGINWLSNRAMSGAASLVLSAKMHGRVQAKVQTYNLTDVFSGKFKKIDVKAHGGKLNGVPIGSVHLSTVQPFRLQYFRRKGSPNGLKTPLLVNLDGNIAEKDLAIALKSHKIADNLRFLKLDLPGLGEQRLQVLEPKVDLIGDKVKVDSFLVTAGASKDTGVPLQVVATPKLESDRYIVLHDLQVASSAIMEPQEFAKFAAELLNPLVDFGRMDRSTHAFRMSKLKIANERVSYAGHLVLAPKQAPGKATAIPQRRL